MLSQKWAERKLMPLVITPANLRKQWHQEPLGDGLPLWPRPGANGVRRFSR